MSEDTNNIEELIDAIAAKNFNQAKSHFDDIIGDRMNDALEQEKIAVANQIYNNVNDDDLDIEEEEDVVVEEDDVVVEDDVVEDEIVDDDD